MTTTWYRVSSRIAGLLICVAVLVLAGQWLAISFGWKPVIAADTVSEWSDRLARPLRDGPAILVAVAAAILGGLLLVGWVLAGRRRRHDHAYRLGRRRGVWVDRPSFAASLERRLDPLDRRVDVHIDVDRRGSIHMKLITPDTTATGTVAEHRDLLTTVLAERGLTNRVKSLDVVDVRRMKSRHRVR